MSVNLKRLTEAELQRLASAPGGGNARRELKRRHMLRVNKTPGQGLIARRARAAEAYKEKLATNRGKRGAKAPKTPEPVVRIADVPAPAPEPEGE